MTHRIADLLSRSEWEDLRAAGLITEDYELYLQAQAERERPQRHRGKGKGRQKKQPRRRSVGDTENLAGLMRQRPSGAYARYLAGGPLPP